MVKITVNGVERTFVDYHCREIGMTVDATDLLCGVAEDGLEWSIDFTQATEAEGLIWVTADFVARVLRTTLGRRLPVHFMGKRYLDPIAVEDAVSNSGKNVVVLRDDHTGLHIGVVGDEDPLN